MEICQKVRKWVIKVVKNTKIAFKIWEMALKSVLKQGKSV